MEQQWQEFLAFAKENLRVLFVEDNEDARFLTSLLLEEFFKEVSVAKNGKEALELFDPGRFDVVISDINMPRMSGIELLRRLKQIDDEVFVVLLSAHSDAEYIIEAIEIGVDGYLIKPLEMERLKRLVEKIAQKAFYKEQAKRYESFLKAYEDATNNAFLVSHTDNKGVITYANELFCQRSKYSLEELIGKPHNIVRHPDNPKELYKKMWQTIKEEKKPFHTLLRNQAKDGSSYYVDAFIYPILDDRGEVKEFISIRHDISDIMNQRVQLEMELAGKENPVLIYMKLSDYDFLEELYEKHYIEAIEEEAFGFLNEHLKKRIEFERLYALGDGEFASVTKAQKKREFLQSMRVFQEEVNDSVLQVKDIEYDIEIKLCISFEKEKLLESTKHALQKMKKRNFLVVSNYMERLEKRAKEHFATIKRIKSGLQEGRFVSYFQPIVDNQTKEHIKYEALIRLVENGKPLSPYFFLDVAKQSKYYYDMSKMVLEDAMAQATRYNTSVSLNLSVLDLQKPMMRKFILELLQKNKQHASLLTFEILEDFDIQNVAVVRDFLKQVKGYGVQIAIDDFGSGYANFRRILEYQPDIVKIDGDLIKNILTDNFSESILRSIVTFAKEQNLKVVAEFVENEVIYKRLCELGVDYSQGYYFGKPEPLEVYIGG